MPRAHAICNTLRCLNVATDRGKCRTHKRPAWEGSARNLARPSSWRRIRGQALIRDGHVCVMCGKAATEVDHVIPVARGGTWDLSNLQSLCGWCHAAKTVRERPRRA